MTAPCSSVVLIGAVSVRKGARTHYAVAGFAHCGAGTGRILGPARQATAATTANICRRCVAAIRQALDNVRSMAAVNPATVDQAVAAREALRTPAEIAAADQLDAHLRDTLSRTTDRPARTLGELRAAHYAAQLREQREMKIRRALAAAMKVTA